MLRTDANIAAPDAFYAALMSLHRGLSPQQSRRVNAKLILLLANQIGDMAVLQAAIEKAGEGVTPEASECTLEARG